MDIAPDFPLFAPLLQFCPGHGVGEAESHKLHDLALLPVRQRAAVFRDFFRSVEELAHVTEVELLYLCSHSRKDRWSLRALLGAGA